MGLMESLLKKAGREVPPPPSRHQYGEPKPAALSEPMVRARVIPGLGAQPLTIEGRFYCPKAGAAQDVPLEDARILTANAWVFVARCGTKKDRPELARRGEFFVELGHKPGPDHLIQFDGRLWRDPLTGDLV